MLLDIPTSYIVPGLIGCLIWGGGISTMVETARRKTKKQDEKVDKMDEVLIRMDERIKYLWELKKNGKEDES